MDEDYLDRTRQVVDEGIDRLTPYRGAVADVFTELTGGIRSGLSYCGGHTIAAARKNAGFIRVAEGAKRLEGAHRPQRNE